MDFFGGGDLSLGIKSFKKNLKTTELRQECTSSLGYNAHLDHLSNGLEHQIPKLRFHHLRLMLSEKQNKICGLEPQPNLLNNYWLCYMNS